MEETTIETPWSTWRDCTLELRRGPAGKPQLVGYAAVFGVLSEELWPEMRERIARGAFAKSLREQDVRAYWQHDRNVMLGRTGNGTLELREDGKGLYSIIHPPDTAYVRDLVLEPISRGDVTGMSFGFATIRANLTREQDYDVRELLEVRLHHVSPVDDPAYPQTTIEARARAWCERYAPQARLLTADRSSARVSESMARRQRRQDTEERACQG